MVGAVLLLGALAAAAAGTPEGAAFRPPVPALDASAMRVAFTLTLLPPRPAP